MDERSWPIYDPNEQVEFYLLVEAGEPPVPTTPNTADLYIKKPDGTPVNVDLTSGISNPNDGDLRFLHICDQNGWYYWRWNTTAPHTVEQGLFEVRTLEPPAP